MLLLIFALIDEDNHSSDTSNRRLLWSQCERISYPCLSLACVNALLACVLANAVDATDECRCVGQKLISVMSHISAYFLRHEVL